MKIPYNNAVGKTFEDAELVSDSNVDLYKWISPRPLTEDESNMPADSLATWAMHQANLGWSGNHGAFLHKIAITLKKQQAEIEALKKSCLDEIFKRTYADRSAEVMCEYWQEAQAEVDALKLQLHTTLTNRDLRTYDGKLK